MYLKDLPKQNHKRAHGWPGTIKSGVKNEIDTERGSRRDGEEKAGAEMAQ